MKTYDCLIIEDEPLALERTRQFVERVPTLRLVANFDNALEGLGYLQQHAVDILFLDIKMDELSGIELLESVSLDSAVILTTAYAEYALKGYELSVTDYLLKPFTFPRFLQAVTKAQEQIRRGRDVSAHPEFTFIKTEHRLERVDIADILFIEGMRDYRRIHTVDKRIMTLQNFKELEQELPAEHICRVHKSYMVGLRHIEAIERGRIRIGEHRIPISETYREGFLRRIGS